METIAILAAIGLVLYFHNQSAAASSAPAAPTSTPAQSPPMFPARTIAGGGASVSAGYQVESAFTRFAGTIGPLSGLPLPSTPSYPLPPPPQPRLIGLPAGSGGTGTGSRTLAAVLRTGVSAGTGTTVPPIDRLQTLPRTLVL